MEFVKYEDRRNYMSSLNLVPALIERNYVDPCISEEILFLWSKGVPVLWSTCGHANELGDFRVELKYYDQLMDLGYSPERGVYHLYYKFGKPMEVHNYKTKSKCICSGDIRNAFRKENQYLADLKFPNVYYELANLDPCLLMECVDLWNNEIFTLFSCCGHKGRCTPYLAISNEFGGQVQELGYITNYRGSTYASPLGRIKALCLFPKSECVCEPFIAKLNLF